MSEREKEKEKMAMKPVGALYVSLMDVTKSGSRRIRVDESYSTNRV